MSTTIVDADATFNYARLFVDQQAPEFNEDTPASRLGAWRVGIFASRRLGTPSLRSLPSTEPCDDHL